MKSFLNYSKNRFLYSLLKFGILFLLAYLGITFFGCINVYAEELSINSRNLYIEGKRVDNGGEVKTTFTTSESVENNFVLWGPSSAEVDMIRNGLFINYQSLGSSNYVMKVRFLIKNWNPFIYQGNWGCSSWAEDIYDTSCTISGTGAYADDAFNTINYIDVSYSFSTYGSTFVEFWLWYNSPTVLVPQETYFTYDIQLFEGKVDGSTIIIDQNETIINQNKEQIEEQKETNEKLDELNDSIKDETPPNLDGLENSAGWLPAGPVDSILNLPFSLLNNLVDNLGGTCQPANLPIPFINYSIKLPCMSEVYDEIGISGWVTGIGTIASAFIAYYYLLNLYAWVDMKLTFRENHPSAGEQWGGI